MASFSLGNIHKQNKKNKMKNINRVMKKSKIQGIALHLLIRIFPKYALLYLHIFRQLPFTTQDYFIARRVSKFNNSDTFTCVSSKNMVRY